jgi:hypothetical protein
MRYECVNVAGWEGLGAACTPHEVARMSFTIIEALGIVLDELLVHALVHSVACRGPGRGACSCSC